MHQKSGSISILYSCVISGLEHSFGGEFEEDDLLVVAIQYFRHGIFWFRDVTCIDLPINILGALRSIFCESSKETVCHRWTYTARRDASEDRSFHGFKGQRASPDTFSRQTKR